MKPAGPPPAIIGFAEYVDIPEWHIQRLRAKVDTGARTSALHVENIRELSNTTVSFEVRLHRKNLDRRVTVTVPIKRRARVRSSSGVSEPRIVVSAGVRIGGIEREIELSLVDREKMIFRMLIGRSALAHSFLVDVGRRYVVSGSRSSASRPSSVSRSTSSRPSVTRPSVTRSSVAHSPSSRSSTNKELRRRAGKG
ncbi:MAG TPA: RimK/LysX family protein [Polyangiaceae bacterium]